MSAAKRALALGVGNLLWADEGFGVRCVEAFEARFAPHAEVELADGGTQGLYLVDYFQRFDPVVLFDAVDYGAEPGAMVLIENDAIPDFVAAHKMSLHQAGIQDVIACAKLLGDCATSMLLVGVQPVELEDYGGSLRPAVRARIGDALDAAARYLADHGIELVERETGASAPTSSMTPGLELDRYEDGRPSAEEACRIGDARVLNQRRAT